MSAARRTPLIAAVPKMLFPALVILPGMIAMALHADGGGFIPLGQDGTPDYNMAIPALLVIFGISTAGQPMYAEHSLGMNINLIWGAVQLVFGLLMLALALRQKNAS